jgi:hypothetical protein
VHDKHDEDQLAPVPVPLGACPNVVVRTHIKQQVDSPTILKTAAFPTGDGTYRRSSDGFYAEKKCYPDVAATKNCAPIDGCCKS